MTAPRNHTIIYGITALALVIATGCAELRLPAIDPSGNCFFLPCPNSTTLSLPCCDCERPGSCSLGSGCLGSGCLSCLPKPAFTDPPPPPPCLADAGLQPPAPTQADPSICDDGCCNGPEAVLYDGGCCDLRNLCHLPDRGKRGRILLNHRKIIAPVGGEVVLLSGVCGCDGYLRTGEPIEWMLTPDSVGHFIEVGDDHQSMLHRMVSRNRVKKLSGSYARGRTSTKAALITRGNHISTDDVSVKKGETWLTVSSPSEGISRVTVMAPESDCWDQRKATATIYWVDANWQFPQVPPLAAGEQAQLVTRVTRREGLPATGWKVRYEILNAEVAGFDDGTANLSTVVESVVNENGDARALLHPRNPGAPGTAYVRISIIRPAGLDESLPRMTLGSGQALVTWSAPQLQLRAGAPPFVAQGETFPVSINVANAGDRAAENVRLLATLPAQARVIGSSLVYGDGRRVPAQHQIAGGTILWELGNMPAQQQVDLELNIQANSSFTMPVDVRDASGGHATDRVDVTTVNRNLQVQISPSSTEPVQINQEATFDITVTNVGNDPIHLVTIEAKGDQGLVTMSQDGQWLNTVFNNPENPLLPGQPLTMNVSFVVSQAGERCIQVTATGHSVPSPPQGTNPDQRSVDTACIMGVNPPPPAPAVSAQIRSSAASVRQGERVQVQYIITNTGRVPLTNVDITVAYDETLKPEQLSLHARPQFEQFKVNWLLLRLDPGQTHTVAAEYSAQGNPGNARSDLAVRTQEGASTSADVTLGIVPAPITSPPPVTGGQPTPAVPPPSSPTAPPTVSNSLQLSLSPKNNPAFVGEVITYDLVVTNDRNEPDSDVIVQIHLPLGSQLHAIERTLFPGSSNDARESISADQSILRLQPINQMRAGEEIRYVLRLSSNQAQNMTVHAEASSRLQPSPIAAETRVRVDPR